MGFVIFVIVRYSPDTHLVTHPPYVISKRGGNSFEFGQIEKHRRNPVFFSLDRFY